MKKISIALSYCTNDHVFLKSCIDHILPVAHEVIVSACDHYWNGDEENLNLLGQDVIENPGATFVTFGYDPTLNTMQHNVMSRMVAVAALQKPTDYIMFLDADEIIEPDKMLTWWEKQQSNLMDVYRPANYWYFRDFCYRAKFLEDSVALVRNDPSCINDDMYDSQWDRHAFYVKNPSKLKQKMAMDGVPFVHHYSWVRTKEAMLKKVNTWGHNKDRDWVSLVHKEFEAPFRGKDVIFDREYDTVTPYVNIKLS